MKLLFITSTEEGPLDREMSSMADEFEQEGYQVVRKLWEGEESDIEKALYDIYQSPSLLVTADDGSLIELWQGNLPSVAEVKYKAGNV